MKFKMPQFEVKYSYEKEWKKVTEKAFLESLLDTFTRITPMLSEMFQGKEIITPFAIYRIIN